VFMASRQREAFAFVERDYEDTRSEGRWRRGGVGFGGGCDMSAVDFMKRDSIGLTNAIWVLGVDECGCAACGTGCLGWRVVRYG
jgi:hypothetical protein